MLETSSKVTLVQGRNGRGMLDRAYFIEGKCPTFIGSGKSPGLNHLALGLAGIPLAPAECRTEETLPILRRSQSDVIASSVSARDVQEV